MQVGEQVLEQKSDKPVSQDSIGTYVLNIAGATCSRDMDSVVAILQQMYSKISRYVATTDPIRSGVLLSQ